MPTSTKYIVTPVVKLVEQINPQSILDIGCGFGKWGFLLREYLEIWSWDDSLYNNEGTFKWRLKIDGVEICEKYIKDLQRNIYDQIFIGDAFNVIDKIDGYDLFILGDIIEHFEKEKGRLLLDKCFDKAKKAVLVTTPIAFFPQGDLCGNRAERHKSLWRKQDFLGYGDVQISHVKGSLVAVLSKMDKNFRFENRYRVMGYLNRFIAYLQSRNIRLHGMENHDKGFLMQMYCLMQNLRERKLKKLNS